MSTLQERVVASLFDQSKEISDEITHSHPLLNALEKKKRFIKHNGGEKYRKPVMHNQTALGGFYSGLGQFNFNLKEDYTALEFDIRSVYEPFVMSGRDVRANRGSALRLLDALKIKRDVTQANLTNTIHTSVMSDGLGFGGIGFDGIQAMVSASPSSRTYGGKSGATASYVNNPVHTVSGGLSSTNIQAEITAARIKVARGYDWCDIGIAGATAYKALHSSLTAIQQIVNEDDKGSGGFKSLCYDGIDFYFDGGFGNTSGTSSFGANHIRLLNSKHISMDIEKDFWITPLDGAADRPTDNDGIFVVMIAEGNLCCNAPMFNALIKEA